MKCLLLAGGQGSRLRPATFIYNKHLVVVFNKPLIYYPLATMLSAGFVDFGVVTSAEHIPQFEALLGDGSRWGVRISYVRQSSPGGIAHAVAAAESFVGQERCAVILGDNIFVGEETPFAIAAAWQTGRPTVFLHKVDDPSHYGVATLRDGELIRLEEKPKHPQSNLAVTGVYLYDGQLFGMIRTVTPSSRNELEITDVNQEYLTQGLLDKHVLGGQPSWFDGGKPTSLLQAATRISELETLREHPVGCPYLAAWQAGLIDEASLKAGIAELAGTEYARTLMSYLGNELPSMRD